MVVVVEKIQGPVARIDRGNGQAKNDVLTDIFIQGHENPLARGKKSPWHIQPGARKVSRKSAYLNMKMKGRSVDIIDLKLFNSLKWDGV